MPRRDLGNRTEPSGTYHSQMPGTSASVSRANGTSACSANFGRLKCEAEEAQMFVTRDHARAAIFEYLEVFYNCVRRHSSLGFLSPVEYERAHNLTHC